MTKRALELKTRYRSCLCRECLERTSLSRRSLRRPRIECVQKQRNGPHVDPCVLRYGGIEPATAVSHSIVDNRTLNVADYLAFNLLK